MEELAKAILEGDLITFKRLTDKRDKTLSVKINSNIKELAEHILKKEGKSFGDVVEDCLLSYIKNYLEEKGKL